MLRTLKNLSRGASGMLDALVDQLLESAGIPGPPVEAELLAKRLGIDVVLDASQSTRGRQKRISTRSTIFVRPDPRPERMQWSMAHEIGEAVAWRLAENWADFAEGEDSSHPAREQVANVLASRILLPSCWFFRDVENCREDLFQLKKRYGTASHELIALRMLDGPGAAMITIFDNLRLTQRRSNRHERPPLLMPFERRSWVRGHETNVAVDEYESGCRIQCWPVHEIGWQREILRTSWEDDLDEF